MKIILGFLSLRPETMKNNTNNLQHQLPFFWYQQLVIWAADQISQPMMNLGCQENLLALLLAVQLHSWSKLRRVKHLIACIFKVERDLIQQISFLQQPKFKRKKNYNVKLTCIQKVLSSYLQIQQKLSVIYHISS